MVNKKINPKKAQKQPNENPPILKDKAVPQSESVKARSEARLKAVGDASAETSGKSYGVTE